MGCLKLKYYDQETERNEFRKYALKKSLTSKNTLQTSHRQNLYRYNGKEKDEHTGLYEYGQRYYAPWLCRFVSVDPVAEKFADLSSYNYAGNKPITKRDQEGLQEEGREESPKSGGEGNANNKTATVDSPLINGHIEDHDIAQSELEKAQEKVDNLEQKITGLDKKADKKEYRQSKKELKKATKSLRQAKKSFNRIKANFDIVEEKIKMMEGMENKLAYTNDMIKDLTQEDKGITPEYAGVKVGDKINMLKTLKDAGVEILVYNNKEGVSFKDNRGQLADAVNTDISGKVNRNMREIYLRNGGGEVSIANEIADIFFKEKFSRHLKLDQLLIGQTMEKDGVSRQEAYFRAFSRLYQEGFSYRVTKETSRLKEKR